MTERSTEKGKKFDQGKPRIALIEPAFIRGLAQVLTFGAERYGDYNWQNDLEKHRILSAVYRHLLSYHEGERFDSDSGLAHLYHAACGLMFLDWYDRQEDKENAIAVATAYESPSKEDKAL